MNAGAELALLAERATGIGGSDAKHVMNEAPNGCRRQAWYAKRAGQKLGPEPDFPYELESSKVQERGKWLEPIAAELYAQQTGRRVQRLPVRRRKDAPYLLVHADRMITGDARGPAYLEIKTAGEWAFKKIVTDGVPADYVLQVQHGLMVTGWQWGAFGVLWPDGWGFLHWEFERNDDLVAALEREGHAFWRQVENGPTPDRLEPGAKPCGRCPWRKTCWGAAWENRIPEEDRAVDVERDDSLEELVRDLVDAKQIVAEREALVETIREQLLERLGERTAVDVGGFRVYARWSKPRETFDRKAFAKTEPWLDQWISEEFSKVGKASRTVRVY